MNHKQPPKIYIKITIEFCKGASIAELNKKYGRKDVENIIRRVALFLDSGYALDLKNSWVVRNVGK